jgi:cell division protein FtsL
MANLAKKLQQETVQHTSTQVQTTKYKKAWFSPGEKILGLMFGALICVGSVQIISNQASIYNINKDIQERESAISEQQKVNGDLEVQVSEMSTYERIKEKASKLGLQFNENNVKVVQE